MNRADVLSLFHGQNDVASIAQLTALGMHRRTVRRAELSGAVVEVLPNVFRQAGSTLTFDGNCMAVLLHCGSAAYLSGSTAAAQYGFRSMPRNRIIVTTSPTAHVDVPTWVTVRRAAWTDPADVVTLPNGLRVSSPMLTLFRLASEFNEFRFHRAAEDAWHLGLVDPRDASAYLEAIRRSGKGGVAVFERWLEKVGDRDRPSQSGLELDVIESILDAGLPEPTRQHPLRLHTGETIHIDVSWPSIRLGVEPGHSWWHGGDLQARKDAARDRACSELGWLIVRLDETMRDDLPGVGRQLKRIYESRRNPPAAS